MPHIIYSLKYEKDECFVNLVKVAASVLQKKKRIFLKTAYQIIINNNNNKDKITCFVVLSM